eukprot:gene26232-biopygen15118
MSRGGCAQPESPGDRQVHTPSTISNNVDSQ